MINWDFDLQKVLYAISDILQEAQCSDIMSFKEQQYST